MSGPSAKDVKQWNTLVDDLWELDEAHPYLGQTVEPEEPDTAVHDRALADVVKLKTHKISQKGHA